jgi:phosphoenolpyruvate carboxykinase (GTP)
MKTARSRGPLTRNIHLVKWVEKTAELTKPKDIHWVDGSQAEYDKLCREMVASGSFTRLNEDLWPGCFLARSDPSDVARVEDRTFICSLSKDNAGPTNNWENPYTMRRKLKEKFNGAMQGRTMYVLPFSMGPVGGPMSQIGVELTDSPYVVVNMRIMARIGIDVFKEIDKDEQRVVPCIHSVGAPLAPGQKDVSWPCNPENTLSIFPRPGRSGRTVPATAATRCWARSVLRCASRPTSRATRLDGGAHAHPRSGRSSRQEALRRGGFSQFMRQDEFRHDGAARWT